MSASWLDRRLILVLGKGGVGRSTVAAAIARASAQRGRKTLLFEANANDRFADLLGSGPIGPEISRVGDRLWAINTNPATALEEYGLMVLKFRRVYRMVFENRVTKYFLRAIPGLDDYSILGKAWFHTSEEEAGRPRFDTVVFDMPASGHSLAMLRIPWVIVDTVPDGPLTRDARSLRAMLLDPARTAVVLTTLAEEMPANEARELCARLQRELGLAVTRLVVNQLYPDRFPLGSPGELVLDRLAASATLAAQRDHADTVRRRSRLNQRYLAELARDLPVPRDELPFVFAPRLGPAEVAALARELGEGPATG